MMGKPSWLVRHESEIPRKYRMCIDCKHVGDPCGMTNNLGKGIGRVTMYACKLHPTVQLYCKTYACEDYERDSNNVTK